MSGIEALAAGLPFMTCLGGVPGALPVVLDVSADAVASPLVFLRLKRPIGTGFAVTQKFYLSGGWWWKCRGEPAGLSAYRMYVQFAAAGFAGR